MKKIARKARPLAKKVAPIKSTSGRGFAVEDRVAAVGAAAMLLGRSPFPVFPGRLIRMSFQVRPDGWHFEDILFTFEREVGSYQAGTSVRSKREISSRSISADVKDALGAQFLYAEPFRRGTDRLALVSATHEPKVTEAIRALSEAAVGDASALPRRIEEPGTFNETAQALYRDLDAHFKTHGVPVDAAAAFASFDLLELDMADFERSEPEPGRQLCAELLHDPSEANVSGLWEALVTECQKQKHQRGYLDLDRVLKVVRPRFRLKAYPHDIPDWEIIDRETRGQLERIPDRTAGVLVPRAAAKEPIARAVAAHPVTTVVGPSGCGKSSLLKQWLPGSGYAVQVWTKVSAWPRPEAGNLAHALGLDGLELELPGLFQRVAGSGLLVIDAVEHCVDEARLSVLAQVIGLARPKDPDTPWHVVLLVRAEDWGRVRESLARKSGGLPVHVEPLADFTAEDVTLVARAVPGLASLARQPRLESVLRKAKILSLVADHLQAGGTVDPKDLAGESHLALWWWLARVRTGPKQALRARAMETLVAQQAEFMQHAVPEAKFEPALLEAFEELVKDGVCVRRGEALAVQHDLYADWTRLQLLIREGEKWLDYAKARLTSPWWHRAIRLYAIWLLEQPGGGPAAWAAQVNTLGQKDDSSQLIGDLFVEAPLLSAAPAENLRAVWPSLAAVGGNLLHRMLERLRQTGTFPNETLIELLQKEGGFPREELVAHFRLPYPQYWLPLIIVLHEHQFEAANLAPVAVARTAFAWLQMLPKGWPGCRQAAELAIAVAQPFAAGPKKEVWFPKQEEEQIIYRALLASVHERPSEVARLTRVLAGLRPASGGRFGKRWITRSEGFSAHMVHGGVTYEVPPPWPGGPYDRGKTRFTELVLQTNAIDPVIAADPALARELLLAAHIPERDVERGHRRDRFEPEGMVHDYSLQAPFYTRGSFLKLLQASPAEGRRLVVDLVNHYTDRWMEWSHHGGSVRAGTQVWKGDGTLYLAYRGATHIHPLITSALMALEKYLLDKIDRKESIAGDLRYLRANSRSLAIAGVLVALGKKVPALLFKELWPFVASPELQTTEFHSFALSGRITARSVATPERQLKEDWDNLPVHRMALHDVCRQSLPYAVARPKLKQLAARWRKLLANPKKLTVDAFTLHKLAEQFDPGNWAKRKEGENQVWEYTAPQSLLKAAERRSAERGDNLLPLLTVPVNCRTLLNERKSLTDGQLDSFYAQLDTLPRGQVPDDDGKHVLGSLADAQCAIIAVLVNLGREWLDRQPDKAERCGGILRQHLAAPPPPRAHIYDHSPFDMTWENFCAEAAPYFLARNPADAGWRAAVADLLGRPHLQTARVLFRRTAGLQPQLGVVFDQLLDLGVWVAAARHVTDFTEHGQPPALDWDAWWQEKQAEFVAGKVPPLPDDWSVIDVGAADGRHRDRSFGSPVKVGLIVSALDSLALAPGVGWGRVHGLHRRLLDALVNAVPLTLGKSERPELPTDPEVQALFLLGAHLARVEDAGERRRYWEPLLSRGAPAAHHIKYFLQSFLSTGANNPTTAFTDGWKEIVAWAEEAPAWKFTDKGPHYEMRGLWRDLLALGGALPTATITAMKDYYERWAGHDLRDRSSAPRFINFLQAPAALPLLNAGLRWLDQAFDLPPDKRWGFRELAPGLSAFLQWAWTNHEQRIRGEPEAFAAFRQLLVRLAAEQEQSALALLTTLSAG